MPTFTHRLKNILHTSMLFVGMSIILSLVGFIVAGVDGILWAVFLGIMILAISPRLPPSFIFSLYGGQLLPPELSPSLYQIIDQLSIRANLPASPLLYYLPSPIMNAYSVGTPANPAIGLSDALLNTLTTRELIAVLAHEISHIQHNDIRVMTYADIINRITSTLSLTGFLLILINLPLYFLGMVTISWLALIVLLVAPTIMSFLQLSLSRIREFEADHQAVLLTGDPEGLAMALGNLEEYETTLFDRLLGQSHSVSIPSILRTHPDTEERIKRLLNLQELPKNTLIYQEHDSFTVPIHYQNIKKSRRYLDRFLHF